MGVAAKSGWRRRPPPHTLDQPRQAGGNGATTGKLPGQLPDAFFDPGVGWRGKHLDWQRRIHRPETFQSRPRTASGIGEERGKVKGKSLKGGRSATWLARNWNATVMHVRTPFKPFSASTEFNPFDAASS